MEDWIKSFTFDLQRFAYDTFTNGAVEGEEGITLSNLFTNSGKVWTVNDALKLGSRTYFWENGDAKVSLATAANNAPGSIADGITLVKGTYDDPTQLSNGSWAYAIDEVEAIDASGVNGNATFSKLDGVTEIVNPKGTIDIKGDNLGALKFGGNTSKEWNYDFDYDVGTIIHLDGNKEIIYVEAATYEEITSADGTKVVFKKSGTATFDANSFNYVTAYAQSGIAELDITKDNTKKTVSVNNVVDYSEVTYKFSESGDIIDLTSTAVQSGKTLAVTAGDAKFIVANDVSDTADINIGGTEYKFTDASWDGGVFVVENNKAVGFVFSDADDAVTVPKGSSGFKFYEQSSEDETLEDLAEVSMGFTVTSTNSEYTVTKTYNGYSIEVGGNTTLTTDSGATMKVTVPSGATEIFSFDEDGRLQSIEDSTVEGGAGTSLTIKGLSAAGVAEGFNINGAEIIVSSKIDLTIGSSGELLITGTSGNDTIETNGENVSINAGAGNDFIFNYYEGKGASINGGAGNDSIYNDGEDVLFQYASGDGNDLITGFNETSTLSIGNGKGSYSTVESGDDLIVTVGNGKITLSGAASLDEVNIAGVEAEKPTWRIKNTTATYGTSKNTLITVKGVKSLDGLSLSGKVVTVNASAMSSDVVTISDGYTLDLNIDVDIPDPTPAGWQLSGLNATYYEKGEESYYVVDDNKITYCQGADGEGLVTVYGVKSLEGLELNGNTITVSDDSLKRGSVTISDDSYTLALGSDVTKTSTTAAGWSLSGTTATYKNEKITAGYKLTENQISYVAASGGETLVTVNGVTSTDGLTLNGKKVTVSAYSLNKGTVTISDGYTLALGSDVTKTSTTAAGWSLSDNAVSYKNASITAGYSLADNQISYVKASGGNDLFTIAGINSTVGVSLQDKEVTLTDTALANRAADTITISKGYTLKLAAGVDTIKEDLSAWTTLDGGNVAYLENGTGDYYSLSGGNKITYHESVAGDNKVELSGVKGKLNIGDGIVSLTASNFSGDAAVVSNDGGYGFALSGNLASKTFTATNTNDSIINSGSKVTIAGGAGNDYIQNDSKGKTVLFTYNEGDGNDSIVGFNTTSTLQIGDGTGNYSKEKSGADIIVTVGDGKITLVGAANLSKVNIKGIQKEDVLMTTNKTANTVVAGTAYDDDIVNKAKNVTINGGGGNDELTTKRKTSNVKLYGEAGDDVLEAYSSTKVLLDGGADNDDIYVSGGSNNTIVGGTGDDTIEIENATGTLIKYTEGDGNDVIEGFGETSTLSIANGTGTYSISQNGDDIIIKAGSGQITLKGAASWLTYDEENPPEENIKGKFVPDGDVLYLDDKSPADVTIDSEVEKVDATARTKKPIKIVGNDIDNSIVGSANKNSIEGGAGYDTLVGGKVADILDGGADDDMLWGGAGNDTLTGGTGEDLFIYTAGKDVITDYTTDEDAIQIASKWSKSSIKGNDVILTFGSSSKTLTIKNGRYKEIMFVDKDGNAMFTDAEGNETGKVFGITYLDDTTKSPYTAKEDENFIDATKRTKTISITGNDENNTIRGGSNKNTLKGGNGYDYLIGGKVNDILDGGEDDDTLWGGAGNDTLTGGDGDDVFIYTAGKDVITDYAAGDKISLGADGITVEGVKATLKGSNVVLTIGKGTLTVNDAESKKVSLVDKTGNERTIAFGLENVTLTNADASPYKAAENVGNIDVSKRTKAIKITGNDNDNVILGGTKNDTIYGEVGADSLVGGKGNDKLYGGEDDDTLIGGKGNDTLWGGGYDDDGKTLIFDDGADTFIYNKGDGKDVIYGFDEDDVLQLNGVSLDDITASKSTTAVVLTIDANNTITFKKSVTEVYNINGDFYEVKGNRLVKYDD